MKANRGTRSLLVLAAAVLATFVAGCSEKRIVPAPTPTPTATPRRLPPAPPLPPRAAAPRLDWRDLPITAGDWVWGNEAGRSVARFAGGALTLRCDRASGSVTLLRAGSAQDPVPLTVTTTTISRTLTATPQPGPPAALTATLNARDSLLDAMAFSRGRFMVEAAGLPTLYVPSWPEVSRVIEDCR